MDDRRQVKVYLSPNEVNLLEENLRRWGFKYPETAIEYAVQNWVDKLVYSKSKYPLITVGED